MISRKNHSYEKRGAEKVTFKQKRFRVEPMFKYDGYHKAKKEQR